MTGYRPGESLKPGEDEREGLKARLNKILSPVGESEADWEIGELLATWWRPNFETFVYPYIPAHITKPKEMKKVYLVHLPQKKVLSVPNNMRLLAVPLFELYDNSYRYGQQLTALPHILRYKTLLKQYKQKRLASSLKHTESNSSASSKFVSFSNTELVHRHPFVPLSPVTPTSTKQYPSSPYPFKPFKSYSNTTPYIEKPFRPFPPTPYPVNPTCSASSNYASTSTPEAQQSFTPFSSNSTKNDLDDESPVTTPLRPVDKRNYVEPVQMENVEENEEELDTPSRKPRSKRILMEENVEEEVDISKKRRKDTTQVAAVKPKPKRRPPTPAKSIKQPRLLKEPTNSAYSTPVATQTPQVTKRKFTPDLTQEQLDELEMPEKDGWYTASTIKKRKILKMTPKRDAEVDPDADNESPTRADHEYTVENLKVQPKPLGGGITKSKTPVSTARGRLRVTPKSPYAKMMSFKAPRARVADEAVVDGVMQKLLHEKEKKRVTFADDSAKSEVSNEAPKVSDQSADSSPSGSVPKTVSFAFKAPLPDENVTANHVAVPEVPSLFGDKKDSSVNTTSAEKPKLARTVSDLGTVKASIESPPAFSFGALNTTTATSAASTEAPSTSTSAAPLFPAFKIPLQKSASESTTPPKTSTESTSLFTIPTALQAPTLSLATSGSSLFGSKPETTKLSDTAATASTPLFTGMLGTASTTATATTSTAAPVSSLGFSFGAKTVENTVPLPAPVVTTTPEASGSGGINFGNLSAPTTTSSTTPTYPGLNFGTVTTTSTTVANPSSFGGISFGKPPTSTTTSEEAKPAPAIAPSFGFGTGASTSAPSIPGFTAIAPSTDTTKYSGSETAQPAFKFGITTTTTSASASTTTAPAPTNLFGNSGSTFSFGASSTSAPSVPGFTAPVPNFGTASTTAPQASSAISFNAGPSTTSGLNPLAHSFNFGSTTASSTTSAPTFGSTTANTAQPTFGNTASKPVIFGAPASTTTPVAVTFGTNTTNNSIFGSQPATSTSNPSATLFGNTATGFGSTTSFGTTTTSNPTLFGSTTATNAPSFGSTATTNAPSFGSNASTNVPSFGFGTNTTTTNNAASAFGTAAKPPSTAFTFGGVNNAPTATQPPAIQFGVNNNNGNTTGFGASGGFTFGGANATTTTVAPATRFAAPLQPSQQPSFTSGGASQPTAFGTATNTATQPTFGTGFGQPAATGFGQPSQQPQASFTFGASAPPSSGPVFGQAQQQSQPAQQNTFAFGASNPSAPVFGAQVAPQFGQGTQPQQQQGGGLPPGVFSFGGTAAPGSTPATGGGALGRKILRPKGMKK
ncbi:hypothetical protein HK098_004184 [Nowakowskiella sp. JEL0407]|nr:hypothetical protein HK098_004184 [Nowakowskiella sp. JEL0407]